MFANVLVNINYSGVEILLVCVFSSSRLDTLFEMYFFFLKQVLKLHPGRREQLLLPKPYIIAVELFLCWIIDLLKHYSIFSFHFPLLICNCIMFQNEDSMTFCCSMRIFELDMSCKWIGLWFTVFCMMTPRKLHFAELSFG